MLTLPYREVWAIDTEFNLRPSAAHFSPADPQPEGSIQHPVCLVAVELYSGRTIELFEDELGPAPPFSLGEDVLFIAYNAVAEWLTFLALGWPLPCRVFDPYIEYRRHICGTPRDVNVRGNKSFLMALRHFGIPGLTADVKDEERDFVLRGGPWPDPADRRRILDYCGTDVAPLFQLTECLLYADCCGAPLRSDPAGLAQAIHRGRFSLAAARMEHTAIAVDTDLLDPVTTAWDSIRATVIADMDKFGVYPGGHFSNAKFLECMDTLGIPWPRADSGLPKTDKDTFKDMVRRHPELAPISELRYRLSEMHLEKLQVGADGRNRASCMMFGSKTSRNTPSQNKYLFGLAKWTRHFLKPAPGTAAALLDYRNQEYHIAGVLSGDDELLRILAAPDPYMAFAIAAGLAPAGASKASHPEIRAVCKTLLLGTNYGMGAGSFAFKANIPIERAEHIHTQLKRTFSRYHQWSSEVVREARAGHWLHSVYGWRQFMDLSDVLTIKNWKMQANGAEMTRLACCLATERGVSVCGPIHDAILVESPIDEVDDVVALARAVMEEASREVLEGHTVPVDAEVVRWPDRYRPKEKESRDMWERVLRLGGVDEGVGVGVGVWV
jgi:DNA polymerase I